MTDATRSDQIARAAGIGRREVLRIGATTVGLGALVAACGTGGGGPVGRVGVGEPADVLPDATVNDGVLLRTGSSLHQSIAAAYQRVIGKPDLLAAEHDALATQLHDNHLAMAKSFEDLTTGEGATPWTCGNDKFDATVINPVLDRITTGVPAAGDTAAVPPSDDPKRDVLSLLHALETVSSATSQFFVQMLSKPELRSEVMAVGVSCGRQAALLALTIKPGAYVSETNAKLVEASAPGTAPSTTVQNIATPTTQAPQGGAPAPTDIPAVFALPGAFGQLGPELLVVGAGDVNGVRLKINVETPAENSYVYDYMQPAC